MEEIITERAKESEGVPQLPGEIISEIMDRLTENNKGKNKVCFPPKYSWDDLKLITDGLSEDNFIGRTQFGKVYHGKIRDDTNGTEAQEVTAKIWVEPKIYFVNSNDNECRLRDEICLLQDRAVNSHPNLVKLIGYCSEGEHLAVIYDLKSLDTLHSLIFEDTFTWLQRIKAALGLACVLEFLHTKKPPYLPYLVRNLAAAHVMLDQDYNLKLIDFSMISGGMFPDRRKRKVRYLHGSFGFIDMYYASTGKWSEWSDVFSFGVVLLGLITKRVFEPAEEWEDMNFVDPFVYEWAQMELESRKSELGFPRRVKYSLVDGSLMSDPGFYPGDGAKITTLAMRCVDDDPYKRPNMEQVVKYLLNVRAVKRNAEILGIDQLLCDHREALKVYLSATR